MARRTFTHEEKAAALALYVTNGPTETARLTGIPVGTIKSWVVRNHVVAGMQVPERVRAAVEMSQLRTKQRRSEIGSRLIEKVHDALSRMDEPHVEFVGREGVQVEYPKAPASAFRMYALAVESLIRVFRLEGGESTANTALDIRARIEQVARAQGLNPDELMAEAEAILAGEGRTEPSGNVRHELG